MQRVGLPGRVNREKDVLSPAGVADGKAGGLIQVRLVPAGGAAVRVLLLVREPLKGIEAVLDRERERLHRVSAGDARLIADTDALAHGSSPPGHASASPTCGRVCTT